MENNWETDQNVITELINRFESQLQNNESIYFDIEDFDDIANYYMDEGNYKLANISIEKAEMCYPESEQILILKADLLFCQEKYEDVIEFINNNTFIELLAISIFIKAKCYLYLAKYKEASYEVEEVIKLNTEEKENIIIDISDILLESNESERAINIILLNFTKDELTLNLLQQIAYCYETSGNSEKAEVYYNKCLDKDPFNKDLWVSLGMLQDRNDSYEQALESFNFALTIDDTMDIAINGKANTLISLGRHEEALEIVEGLEDDFIVNFIKCKVAEIYSNNKEYEKAIQCYKELIERDPDFTIAYLGLSVILSKQLDFENAILYIDKAIEQSPENTDYYFIKGEMLLNMGALQEAALNFKQVLMKHPDDTNTWLALSYADPNELVNGINTLEKGLEDYENTNIINEYLYALAVLHFRKNNITECLYYLNKFKDDAELISNFTESCPGFKNNQELESFLNEINTK